MKYFNLYAKFWFLYFISTPSNHSLLCFWFYLRYKNKYVLFDVYFAKFNFLCFISTPSNHLPICVWFYLRYKIRKIIQSSVLSFPGVFEGCEFPPSFSFSVFLLLLGRKPVVRIFWDDISNGYSIPDEKLTIRYSIQMKYLPLAFSSVISCKIDVFTHQICKVLLPVSLVVHKCIARCWEKLRECTLGSYRVLHSISINITKILACVVQVDAFIISL